MPPLMLVLALADDGALGYRGGLPWDIPEDRRHYERLTIGHAVIMGRRTWEEAGAPLPGRRSIVVSRRPSRAGAPDVEWVDTFDEALARARQRDPDPRVIGGAAIFELAMPHATRIELTEVHRRVVADTYFRLDRAGFAEIARRPGASDPTIDFVTLERIGWIAP